MNLDYKQVLDGLKSIRLDISNGLIESNTMEQDDYYCAVIAKAIIVTELLPQMVDEMEFLLRVIEYEKRIVGEKNQTRIEKMLQNAKE